MTDRLRKILHLLSEQRERFNTIYAKDAPSDSETSELVELRTKLTAGESEFQDALDEDGKPAVREVDATELTTEQRERLELREKSKLANYMRAAIDRKPLTGSEAELSAAYGCPGSVPFEFFEERELETRAITPGPADAPTTFQPIVPALFQRSAMSWLGIDMPTVGFGDQGYPILTGSVDAGPKAKSAEADETAGAIGVTTATPRRITGAFGFRREDAARLGGLEEALRMNLGQVVSDALDNQGVNGSGVGDGTINGLLAILTNPSAPATGQESFARYVAAFGGHVDGTYAVDLGGIRALVGPHTYRHAVGTFRADASADTAESWIQTRTGGMRVSARIGNPASNIQQAIIRRANPAGDSVAVMPVWSGLELIRDDITSAKKGEVTVTAIVLVGDVVVLRSGCFVQDSFRLG